MTILVAQAGWIVLLFARTSILVTFIGVLALGLVELAGPVVAETRYGGTPWHARHIAERYGLLLHHPGRGGLDARRERAFGWGYGHIPMFGAVVAVGAGLHVAAY